MTHDHDHGAHGPRNAGRAFALGIGLNLAFVLVEAVYGVLAHSMALLADAGHNLSDVLALTLAWGASTLAKRGPSERFTYGLRSSSILVALLNAALLFVVTGGIAWEAINRLAAPMPVAGETVIWVALVGILINGASAMLFARDRRRDVNRSEEHTSELQSRSDLVCRLLLEKKKKKCNLPIRSEEHKSYFQSRSHIAYSLLHKKKKSTMNKHRHTDQPPVLMITTSNYIANE